MAKHQSESLNEIRCRGDCTRAVVFLHGFSGDRDDTWGTLPLRFGTADAAWDIYTLGYATTLMPDMLGFWSGDPDLPVLSTMLITQFANDPLRRYKSLALVAHSMGGLVAQRALLDAPELADRMRNVILFGTPSAGSRKASWTRIWKRQLRNMAAGSDFIKSLRRDWDARFGTNPSFDLKVVAGEEDRFVSAESSLEPFPKEFRHVISGDHHSMLRPSGQRSPIMRLLTSALSGVPVEDETSDPLMLAAEVPNFAAPELIDARGEEMSQEDIVRAALAWEQNGRRDEAIALLQRYQALGTDVQGALAGRVKRLWMENEDPGFARHALDLYLGALDKARKNRDKDQIYYHAINVAFLEFVAFGRVDSAREMAELALENATLVEASVWSVATRAEANLYLRRFEPALELYRAMREFEGEPWQYASTALQAGLIAIKLEDTDLADRLEEVFTPSAKQANGILVGYHPADSEWKDRLCRMLAPYLRDGDVELKLWTDGEGSQDGAMRHGGLGSALASTGVAVVLVSASFLASAYVTEHALREIEGLAVEGKIQPFWVYVSHAPYEATELRAFEAAHDISQPLRALARPQQDEVLLNIARDIKAAALGATTRFRSQEQ